MKQYGLEKQKEKSYKIKRRSTVWHFTQYDEDGETIPEVFCVVINFYMKSESHSGRHNIFIVFGDPK